MMKSSDTVAFEAALQLTITTNKSGSASHVLDYFKQVYEGLKEIAERDNIHMD